MAIKAYSYAKDGNRKLSANFAVKEFRCKDGSDPIFIDDELVTLLQELGSLVHLGVEVVGVDVQGKADLLEFNHFLVLLGFLFLFLHLEPVFTVIKNFAHRRLGLRRDLDEVKVLVDSHLQCVARAHNAHLRAIRPDQADFFVADLLIDFQFVGFAVAGDCNTPPTSV